METVYKFQCQYCNYKCKFPSDWIKHEKTQRHIRGGQSKIHKCSLCDYVSKEKWNLDLHIKSQHSTKEERSKCKYYCDICDKVFFTTFLYNKHMNGVRHKNTITKNIV
jgi:hypothetical protein